MSLEFYFKDVQRALMSSGAPWARTNDGRYAERQNLAQDLSTLNLFTT